MKQNFLAKEVVDVISKVEEFKEIFEIEQTDAKITIQAKDYNSKARPVELLQGEAVNTAPQTEYLKLYQNPQIQKTTPASKNGPRVEVDTKK